MLIYLNCDTDYCYPENYHEDIPGIPKILALDKKHDDIETILIKNIY